MSEARLEEIKAGSDLTLMELRQIAAKFRLDLRELVGTYEGLEHAKFDFRISGKFGKGEKQDIGDALSGRIVNVLSVLNETHQIPEWIKELEVDELTRLSAETAAYNFRNLFYQQDQESPFLDLPYILADQCKIFLSVVPKHKFDGASILYAGVPFIFLSPRFEPRMLFTLAHEVGHFLVSSNDEFAHIDGDNSVGLSSKSQRKEEAFANAFASALLMPLKGVGVALKEIRSALNLTSSNVGDIEILYLAHIFGVSFETMALRLEILQILPSGSAVSLYEHLVKNHQSPEKRAREAELPSRPKIDFRVASPAYLAEAVQNINAGKISLGAAADMLGCDIENLLGETTRIVH